MKYLTKDEMLPKWTQFKKEIEAYILSSSVKPYYLEARVPDYLFSSLLNGVVREGNNTILYKLPVFLNPMKIADCEVHFIETNENKLSLYNHAKSDAVVVIEKDLEVV